MTGRTTFSRLLLLKYIKQLSGKKVLFITSTEQSAMRYSADLERLFELRSEIIPYQNTSPYELLQGSLYDFEKQINILHKKPNIIVAPAKVLLEKFPTEEFYSKNSINLKIGDNISQKDLLTILNKLGYKRSTMVSDIGEFSIRGDIADIFTLYNNPLRI